MVIAQAQPLAAGPEVITTGHGAWWVTWLLTEPMSRRAKPPLPRAPTTSRSAPAAALISSSAGEPLTDRTVTEGGRDPVISLAALSAPFWAAVRAFSSPGLVCREGDGGVRPRAQRDRVHGENGERDLPQPGLPHRPLERPLGTL
jgi:hypothetical protein